MDEDPNRGIVTVWDADDVALVFPDWSLEDRERLVSLLLRWGANRLFVNQGYPALRNQPPST